MPFLIQTEGDFQLVWATVVKAQLSLKKLKTAEQGTFIIYILR